MHETANHTSTSTNFFDLNILNVEDLIYYQISSLMWDFDHNSLPSSLRDNFKRANTVHHYKTRGALGGNLYHTKVNTQRYGIKAFKYQGIQVLNSLKRFHFYQNAKTKLVFFT